MAKLEIHIHIHNDNGSLALIQEILAGLKEGIFPMALSPEMQAFVDAVTTALSSAGASLANINADIQKLLATSTGLSQEDKDALTQVTEQLNNLSASLAEAAAVVPE